MLSFIECIHNGLRACDLMPRLCRNFFELFTKVCSVLFYYFCRDFLLSLPIGDLKHSPITVLPPNEYINTKKLMQLLLSPDGKECK